MKNLKINFLTVMSGLLLTVSANAVETQNVMDTFIGMSGVTSVSELNCDSIEFIGAEEIPDVSVVCLVIGAEEQVFADSLVRLMPEGTLIHGFQIVVELQGEVISHPRLSIGN